MKIGFAKESITPPPGTELGGYAGYRPCSGVHDPLWCKAVVLEQDNTRYALLALDLLCVDESLAEAIDIALKPMGIRHTLAAAIHSHATPCGIVLGEGPLAEVNRVADHDPVGFSCYTQTVIAQAVSACAQAVRQMESFQVRTSQSPAPIIGSERHTGEHLPLTMTVVEIMTESGRTLLLYQIPCHPTVLGPDNLLASADFVGGIEKHLTADMSVFLNGAAGDISTRFTRHAQTFEECERMAEITGCAVMNAIQDAPYKPAASIKGLHTCISLKPRPIETEANAKKALNEAVTNWQAAVNANLDAKKIRTLRSYVEGAGVALEFVHTMAGIQELQLPVTVFSFAGLQFVAVPGEIFSSLWHVNAVPICYTNGYYRYITDTNAYDVGYYEAMAAILDRGQGEVFMERIGALLQEITV